MKNLPQPPVSLTTAAKKWWQKVVQGWVLDDPALLVLQAALEACDRMKAAAALVEEHGIVAPDRWGQLKINPAVLVERDSRAAMLAGLKQLGLDLEPLHEKPGRPPGK
jgi:P27 family predicted phage terminase small subunit